MSAVGPEGNTHQTRRHVRLAVALGVGIPLAILAIVLAIRALMPGGGHASLSLYNSGGAGHFSAQVQYACEGDPCGEQDRIFFEITGEGVEKPSEARVGDAEITEAVVRKQEGGLLAYFDIPPDEPGYSIIDFPCSDPGAELQVEVIVESDGGEDQSSASGSITCPSK